MKWTISLSILLLLTLVLPTAASEPESPLIPKDIAQTNALQYNHLMTKVQTDGFVRVIIGLDTPFQPEGTLPSLQAAHNQQATIAQTQDAVLNRIATFEVSAVKPFPYIPYMAMTVDEPGLAALIADPQVSTIEEDQVLHPVLADSVPLLGADRAADSGYNGEGWTIAVLDSGIDQSHPFLKDKVVSQACFSETNERFNTTSLCPNGHDEQTGKGAAMPCNASELEWCAHGTHVAGIIAGNSQEMAGVAPGADLIAIQIFSRSLCPTSDGGEEPCLVNLASDLIRGLSHVYDLKRKYNIAAVNLSLGGMDENGNVYIDEENCDTREFAIKAMVDTLHAANIATIAASGNDFSSEGMETPACISNVVSVGATDDSDNVQSFSNSADFLDLLAPGKNIVSSIPGGDYGTSSGTSQATPHVAGAWAALKSCDSEATLDDILTALKSTGIRITDERNGVVTPRIRIDAALQELGCQVVGTELPSAPVNLTAESQQERIELTWQDTSINEAGFLIERSQDLSGTWVEIAQTGPNVTTYADTEIACETTYFYRIRAFNSEGYSDYSNLANDLSSECSAPAPPIAPTNLVASASGQTSITLHWEDNSTDEQGFVIERSVDGQLWQEVTRLESNSTTYTDTGLQCGTQYFYQVSAFRDEVNSVQSNRNDATTEACTIATAGDCNVDGTVDAGDLSALAIEISEPLFRNRSCDTNGDTSITEADLDCTVQIAFGKTCTSPGASLPGPSERQMPQRSTTTTRSSHSAAVAASPKGNVASLAVPDKRPAQSSSTVAVPIIFDSGGESVSSIIFSIDYNEMWLTIKELSFEGLPEAFGQPTIQQNSDEGRLNIAIFNRALPLHTIPDGTLMTITFEVSEAPSNTLATVGFSNDLAASFGIASGQNTNGATFDGSVQIRSDAIEQQHVYLPLIGSASSLTPSTRAAP